MIDGRILRLTPKRFFCPFFGNWYDWKGKALQSYSEDEPYECQCGNIGFKFWADEDCISIKSRLFCNKIDTWIDDTVYLDDIECDLINPIIKFSIPIYSKKIVCSDECEQCKTCNLPNIGDERDDDEDEFRLDLEFKFEFLSKKYFNEYAQSSRDKQKELEEEKRSEQELAKTHETKKQLNSKEDTAMANKFFNMNMEFGPNKDENIASTLMGVAVKNGDNWLIYDKKKKEITDVGDMQLGNLPIFILPTTKLTEGDLIKDAGEYYFVNEVRTGSTQTLCAKTGEMKDVIPIKNVLGFSCYSKVIALSDSLNIGADFDVEKLAIISAMCGQSGENGSQMNQLLPFMLFEDKLGGDDDTMKLALMSSMMTSGEDGSQMNQLLPLMFFKNGDNGNDDMMKLVLMSSMMGGSMAGSNNPLMSYLMLDTFMDKKEDKAPRKTDEENADEEITE